MPVELCRASVQKLTHESCEIRLRTLEQIEAKVMRALAHKEEINFKPGELFKQLIRWFGFKPLEKTHKVLRLMLELLRSRYGDQVLEQIGLERCQRELGKVQQLLKGGKSSDLLLVEDLLQYCSEYKLRQELAIEELSELTSTISISDSVEAEIEMKSNSSSSLIDFPEMDFEVPWSKATIADYNSMKFLVDLLVNPLSSCDELLSALQHLQLTMSDYPAEYFLQAPHIFLNMAKMFERQEELQCPLEDILNVFLVFLDSLRQRLYMRIKSIYYAPTFGSVVMHKTQLKLPKVLQMVMEMCMSFLEKGNNKSIRHETLQIIALIRLCLDIFASQKLKINIQTTARFTRICQTLKEGYAQNEHFTLQRINYLLLVFLLHRLIEINSGEGQVMNSPHLFTILSDYAIKACYPQSYRRLQQLISSQDVSDLKIQFDLLDKYEQQFFHMVALLKSPKTFNATYIIENSNDLMPDALKTFASPQIIATLFKAISSCLLQFLGNCALRKKANNLLIKLLSLTDEKFAVCAFNHLAERFKQHFCALMNGTGYSAAAGCCNSKLLAAQIIGVPLSTSLLLKLTHSSFESSDAQIRQCCDDILSMLLRSQNLLGSHWCRLLELVLPIMPMLQCCTKSAKINKALLKLFDPDARQMSFTDLLKCNTRWLFHPESDVRSECLTRLVYMLQTLENASKYVPNLSEVSDLIPNDICLVSLPRSNSTIFSTSTTTLSEDLFAEVHNLLAILESPDIEPIIRKTTLMQLNFMCQHWDFAVSVCREGAYYFSLQALENSLCKASYEDYQDTAIPAIGILVKLLFCDAQFRDELQGTGNIYVLLLRAIFLYANDLQMKQDAAVCLFLLLFATFLITSPPGSSENGIKVPLLMSNLEIPLKCEFGAQKDEEVFANYTPLEIFKTSSDEKTFLRQLIACTFADGMSKLNSSWLEKQKHYDFNVDLQLTPHDWRLLKATQPLQNLRRFLKAAANATNHTTIINAVISLRHQLVLSEMEDAAQQIPNEIAQDLLKLLCRYLQVLPGNDMDFVLFEQLLEVCEICTQLHCTMIIVGLFKALQNDFQHAFIVMLQNPEIPLRLYRKLTGTILRLLQHHAAVDVACSTTNATTNDATILYINLFELLFDVTNLFFNQRDLLRVRCVLSLLEMLSTKPLQMADKQLYFYCKRFLNLSISLKSFTQTGAQWQRDCLQLVCRLSAQMEHPHKTFKLNASFIKYLSGMCGHNDHQVRALAWCLLAKVARFKDADLSGVSQLTEELSFLPGGFMACCLSTLLDYAEVGVVRQLAGNLFAEVLPKCLSYVDASALLEQHDFYRVFHDALSLCELNSILPADFDYTVGVQLNTCEIASCFCRICISMMYLHPPYASELCEHTFMYKLYELLKVPVSKCSAFSPEYLVMCADICQVYAMCFVDNFQFLQRTICRDQVWIRCFCLLLDKPYVDEMDHVKILQLLMTICKDPSGFQHVCEHIAKAPEFIVRVLIQTFCVARINTSLQQCALTVLRFLMTISQPEVEYDFVTFADILEKPVELNETLREVNEFDKPAKDAYDNIGNFNKVANVVPSSRNSQHEATIKCCHKIHGFKFQGCFDKNADSPTTPSTSQQAAVRNCQASCSKSAAEFIFIELHRLFLHLYPLKACKFETAPNIIKQQICETIAVLLKISRLAQIAACNLKFFDTLLQIFNTFLEEFNTSCSTFVRRNGDTKKMAIIKNFQLLFNIVVNWFSSGVTELSIDLQVLQFSKILLKIWPWLAYSAELKLLTLQMCSVLNEHSLIVCKQFSTLISSYANSILQLVLKIVIADTQKVKAASTDEFPVIAAGLRVLINCCKCTEGRSALTKARILDIFDNIYPLNPKAPKLKIDIVLSWLQFWEHFSRYSDCAQVRNLNSLCTLINKSKANSKTRLLALCILRNMCFENANRSTLIASTDFMYIVNDIICKRIDEINTECTSYEEQLIVCVSIRKLISGGIKYVAMIRDSKLAKKIKLLHEQLKSMDADKLNKVSFAKDLKDVLNTICCIFSN